LSPDPELRFQQAKLQMTCPTLLYISITIPGFKPLPENPPPKLPTSTQNSSVRKHFSNSLHIQPLAYSFFQMHASSEDNNTSTCMLAASGSSMPKAFLKLMIVSTSFPLSSSPPGGRTEDTNLNRNQGEITKMLAKNENKLQKQTLQQKITKNKFNIDSNLPTV
jgi:hypothetical protein